VQNQTVFVISMFFQNMGMQTPLYFYERGVSFKTGWEPML